MNAGGNVLGVTAIKPVERHGFNAIKWFLYDKDKGAIMGRTPKSWFLIILFYIVYYTCLALFWLGMWLVFTQTMNDNAPKWLTDNGIIGSSPGLGLRPSQREDKIDSSIILFNKESASDKGVVEGYGGWVKRSRDFLKSYENQTEKSCSPTNQSTKKMACNFNANSLLGNCATLPNLGYDKGQPCVYLKLNKIYGLSNSPYNNTDDLPEDMPPELKGHIKRQTNKNQVWVHCRGENPADIESMGPIQYFPKTQGLPNIFFPFYRQENYQSPAVAVQFMNPKIGQLLHVECRAWAHNIKYDRMDRVGIAHFELLVLDNKHARVMNSEK